MAGAGAREKVPIPSPGLLAGFIGGQRAIGAEQAGQRASSHSTWAQGGGWGGETEGEVGLAALLGGQPPGALHMDALQGPARAGFLQRGRARGASVPVLEA